MSYDHKFRKFMAISDDKFYGIVTVWLCDTIPKTLVAISPIKLWTQNTSIYFASNKYICDFKDNRVI